jgi:hypothetical protein
MKTCFSRRRRLLVLVVVPLLTTCCTTLLRQEQVTGHYVANFPEEDIGSVAAKNNETLDLLLDGTYMHVYRDRHAQVIHNSGTWRLDNDFGYTGLSLYTFEKSEKPNREPIGFSTQIERDIFDGKVRIIINDDVHKYLVKVK